ncbi:hypothetical protein [Dyella caseinilytica]|uniref:Phosphoserine phosphatase n=1 Tax=Dyella caseinilytica TaxID=1849581 RepID=A0ABX7GUS3_9GAMM|nr:hypothetical protein [Dyella caseinilytica]QRN53502.1 hypothetical protein ISN74_19150 [Dyella caseinilytica]
MSAEKSRHVREACELKHFPGVYAYGDTHEDLDMLGMASKKLCRWQERDWRACA